MDIRVGFGFDVHQLKKGREFWLGGIRIESDLGADGHSDADVLIHAIADAILGALNLRDIGFHFPNTDETIRNIDSKIILERCVILMNEKGYSIVNIDCTVTLEKTKINPHITGMQKALAPILKISEDRISIKATTNEKMGYVGRSEGINAYAVVLLKSNQ
jgi:2-C-methyl-D-erythritol 2,4-cyclodiphosphate synthase